MDGVILVKLGGSLITDKRRPRTARLEVIARLAGEIARARPLCGEAIVLGHGSGSFGHEVAARHGLAGGVRAAVGPEGLAATHEAAAELHGYVVRALRVAGLPAFSFAPSGAAVTSGGRTDSLAAEPVSLALRGGLLPVVYGDVVLDREGGGTILSTEAVFTELARALQAHEWGVTRALWLGETDGVCDAAGVRIERIRPGDAAQVRPLTGAASGSDVTGGMRHRLDAALELAGRGVSSWIFDGRVAGTLERALCGETVPATVVRC